MIFPTTLFLFALIILPWNQVKGEWDGDESSKTDFESDSSDSTCDICGVSGHPSAALARVINGVAVRPLNKYPWIVPLVNRGAKLLKCGGAVISKWFVLTAAHCMRPKRNGKYVLQQPHQLTIGIMKTDPTVPATILEVAEVIMHPGYKEPLYNNDIALIRLKEPLHCDKYTRPICLPLQNMDRMDRAVIIAGYGRISHDKADTKSTIQRLREGRVRQVDPSYCQKSTSKEPDPDKIFCTLGMGNQTSCEGDSGSSVFGDYDGVFYTLGVTSIHTDATTCPVNGPVTFTNNYAYLDWIQSYVEDLPSPPKPYA